MDQNQCGMGVQSAGMGGDGTKIPSPCASLIEMLFVPAGLCRPRNYVLDVVHVGATLRVLLDIKLKDADSAYSAHSGGTDSL